MNAWRCPIQPVFAIRGFPGFGRVGPIRPVRAIDDPWRDGDHVSTDDDKEELGGVPAVIWRGMRGSAAARSTPHREPSTTQVYRALGGGGHRSMRGRAASSATRSPVGLAEAWEVELAMRGADGVWGR